MEKVLLAIEGPTPDRSTLGYALALCKRMRAGLDILQILSERSRAKYLKKVRQSARRARNKFEDAMVAVTFAEAGQHDIYEQMKKEAYENLERLIPEPQRSNIAYQLTLRTGNPDEQILRYVRDHRDVVLTIYDTADLGDGQVGRPGKKGRRVPQILEKLSTPLVLRTGSEGAGSLPGQGGAF